MPVWLSINTDSSFCFLESKYIKIPLLEKITVLKGSFHNLKTIKQFKARKYIKEVIPELK